MPEAASPVGTAGADEQLEQAPVAVQGSPLPAPPLLVAGLLFFQAGGMKLFDWFGGVPAQFGGHPKLLSLVGMAGILEFYGGAAMMLGIVTRPIAFLLSGEMAVAYFTSRLA